MNLNELLIGYFLDAHMTALINNDFTGLDYENPEELKQYGNSCDTMRSMMLLTLKMKGNFIVTTFQVFGVSATKSITNRLINEKRPAKEDWRVLFNKIKSQETNCYLLAEIYIQSRMRTRCLGIEQTKSKEKEQSISWRYKLGNENATFLELTLFILPANNHASNIYISKQRTREFTNEDL